MSTAPKQRWLPSFRLALGYLRGHQRTLLIGLLAAVGVSVFYTFSVSSIVPVLKIIFAEHETLVDWLHRSEAERRLGITITADVPDDPRGLRIQNVSESAAVANTIQVGELIDVIGDEPVSAYLAARRIANHPGETIDAVRIRTGDGTPRTVSLALRPHGWWWTPARTVAQWLPTGSSAAIRFQTLIIIMTVIVIIALLGGICRFLNEGLVKMSVQRSLHDLRTALAEHTLRLPVAWHSSHPHGDTLARFANDIAKVQVGMTTLFGKLVREPLKAAGVLTLTVLIDWRMLIIGVIGLPIGVLVIRTFGRMVKRAQRRASQSWGRLLDHLGERLVGIRVVKSCNMQSAEIERFSDEDRELTRAQTHIDLVDAASNPVLETLAALAISAFILYGGARVFNHELEPHLFFGAVVCLGGIFDPMRKLGNVNNRLQAAEASAKRLFELLHQTVEEPDAAQERAKLPCFSNTIEFRNVGFAYPGRPEHRVLRDVNVTVEKGQAVALVGPNGSGKTTLVSLLVRFFRPTSGQILIDGNDIADVSLKSLRDQIGLVTQEAVVFSDTVRANIAYGANGVVDDDIRRAAALAHVDDFINGLRVERNDRVLTGYDAPVSARTLSGGQRQRIVLARAILRDPPILILDEATSQVDSESEQRIQEALEDVMRDRTTFVIAHRFSTIARADLIVVLDEGRVVGIGKHDQLMGTCPLYATLVNTQFAGTCS